MQVEDHAFIQGVFYSAAFLVSAYGNPTLAENLISESGISIVPKDLKDAKVDSYDLEVLKPVLKEIRRKNRISQTDKA